MIILAGNLIKANQFHLTKCKAKIISPAVGSSPVVNMGYMRTGTTPVQHQYELAYGN